MKEEEFPLYPQLPKSGEEEAIRLIEQFKINLKKAAEEAISDLYVDIMPHIESDTWGNYRQFIVDGLSNYQNKIKSPYDYKKIRQVIYEEHKEEIIKDLNQDLLEEIKELKKIISYMKESRSVY